MIKMVVTRSKPIRYPSGPTARDYRQGQEFDVLSERDATALSLVQAARRANQPAAITTAAIKAEETPANDSPPATPRRYKRRDMRAED